MKIRKILSLLLAAIIMFACCSCGDDGSVKPASDSPADISAAAMENFVRKLEKGNYVVTGGKNTVTTVYSPEQVYIRYGKGLRATVFVFMTLKNETFKSVIEGTAMGNAEFVSNGNAIDAVAEVLPNGWIGSSGGNMFEFFYNDVEKPLEFTSNDPAVKKTLAGLCGYGEFALSRMEEVRMTMDAVNPTAVRFNAVVGDDESGRHYYDDVDLTLTFGSAKEETHVKKWLKDPVYPPARTEWTEMDLATLGNAFMRDYGAMALPFPETASYAMIFDDHAYDEYLGIRLTDSHWTEKDLEAYKALLKSQGFSEVTGTRVDGTTGTVYRRLLRDEYSAYSQLELYYDDGMMIQGALYHDCPAYEGIEAISGAVQEHGFAPLPATDTFTGWTARDTAAAQTESWAYYFDYSFYMAFDLTYRDREAAKAYLSAYADSLNAAGLADTFMPGADDRRCASPNDYVSFHYKFSEEDNTVRLLFKDQKSLTVDEVMDALKEHGLPETDIHGDIAANDAARYRYEISGFEGLFLSVYQPFASIQDAEHYLDEYVPGLEKQGYDIFDPEKVGSQRRFLYFNEELRKYVGFDLFGDGNGATILFEFASFESELETGSFMAQLLRP